MLCPAPAKNVPRIARRINGPLFDAPHIDRVAQRAPQARLRLDQRLVTPAPAESDCKKSLLALA